jgi:hypothetical protein
MAPTMGRRMSSTINSSNTTKTPGRINEIRAIRTTRTIGIQTVAIVSRTARVIWGGQGRGHRGTMGMRTRIRAAGTMRCGEREEESWHSDPLRPFSPGEGDDTPCRLYNLRFVSHILGFRYLRTCVVVHLVVLAGSFGLAMGNGACWAYPM